MFWMRVPTRREVVISWFTRWFNWHYVRQTPRPGSEDNSLDFTRLTADSLPALIAVARAASDYVYAPPEASAGDQRRLEALEVTLAALEGGRGTSDFRVNLDGLLSRFADVPDAVRVLKIGEEFAEASEAYIGLRGLNPRKGITHTADELADELADVAITALVAMDAFTEDPIQRLTNRLQRVADRLRKTESADYTPVKCDNHDRVNCSLCKSWATAREGGE